MNFFKRLRRLGIGLWVGCALSLSVQAQQSMVMASTTSTEQSGLFSHLLPAFKQASGIDIKVVALGTGQALDMGRRGDADVLFVHDQTAEEKFVAEGFGLPVVEAAACGTPVATARGTALDEVTRSIREGAVAAIDASSAEAVDGRCRSPSTCMAFGPSCHSQPKRPAFLVHSSKAGSFCV